MQTRFKRQFKSTFTQVPDEILNDVNVTLRAKGLYSYLLTKPDNWIYIESVMLREVKEGRDAFRATIKELLECGYLVKEILRDGKGKVKGSCFTLLQEKLVTGKPTSGNPQEAEPTSGNPPSNNTNINHTNLIHTNLILKEKQLPSQSPTYSEIPNNSNSNVTEIGNIKKEGCADTLILHEKNTNNPVIATQKKGAQTKRFIPPTFEEVQAYCNERNNNINPEYWIDYYATRGWKVGKDTMKDWRAGIRTWEQNNFKQQSTINKNYEQPKNKHAIDPNRIRQRLQEDEYFSDVD